MALTETQVVANELERVSPKVPTLFDRDALFYANVEKRPVEKVSNRDMRIPLEIRPGGNFGHYEPDGGDMSRGDGPTFDKAIINTVHLRHAVEWTKKAEIATDDQRKAVLNTFRHLLAKSMSEFRRHVDSLCMTAGDGVLGVVTGVTVNGPVAGFDTLTLTTDGFGARLMRFGQYVNVYNAALSARKSTDPANFPLGTGSKITYHDGPTKTIRIATGITPAATDKLVISGAGVSLVSGSPTLTYPPVSLLGVAYHHNAATTGSWLGMDRGLTPEIRANNVDAAGAGLALSYARLALNKVGDRIGLDQMQKPTAWMHPAQIQAYEELGQLISSIQKMGREENLNLYFGTGEGMQLAGAGIRKSFSWDKKRIDFVLNDVWGRAEMEAPGFHTADGRKIFELRGASGGVAAAQIFYITASFNLFVNNPAACTFISNLAVPAGY